MWSRDHIVAFIRGEYGPNDKKKVFYFNNKCVPVLVGPRHFPGYIESNMWSRHHKNSIVYFKGLPKHLV